MARLHSAELASDDCALLRALGLTDRCLLRVCKAGEPCIVEVKATRIGLSRALARGVFVVPEASPEPAGRGLSDRARRQPEHGQDHPLQPPERRSGQDLQLPGHDHGGAHRARHAGQRIGAGRGRDRRPARALPARAVDARNRRSAATCSPAQGLYRKPDAVVVVVDACNLTRNLMLVGELLAYGEPVVVALNMVDLAQRRGLTLDAAAPVAGDRLPGGADRRPARRGDRSPDARSSPACCRAARRKAPRGLGDDAALEAWADKAVAASVHRHRLGRRHADAAPRRDVHPSDARHPRLRGGHGRHVLDAVRAGAAADGPDRGGVRPARRPGSTARCPKARYAISPPTGSSAASPARWCSCRRSACCSS